MRPINLIPLEDRRGEHAPLRGGPLAYILVGALVLLLLGVVALVTTGNQISEREAEVATLEREDAAASAKATRLAAYTQFRSLSEQRAQTVSSLADSRFDWERVMRELALILPDNVWLESLSASASAEGGSSGGALRGAVSGPALEISGCAPGQEAVAAFVTALKDIDAVTRVGVEESSLPGQTQGSTGSGGEEGSGCQTRDFIAEFTMTVAFDAAPVPAAAGAEGEAPATVTEGAEGTASEAEAGDAESESEAGTE